MTFVTVSCSYCNKQFLRRFKHVQENKKLGHKIYCSIKCQGNGKKRRLLVICQNPKCAKKFERPKHEISRHTYCSCACAAIINNRNKPKRYGIKKICALCKKEFVSRKKYCSANCRYKGQIIAKKIIIDDIVSFYNKNGRIPFKQEFHHVRAARERFGTWNKAIIAAGFTPNPVMFAYKYFAKDGHRCDSLAERIIDDWLYSQNIEHRRAVPYPGTSSLTADFVIRNYWIEFFGLSGNHKRYDELKQQKIKLACLFKLKFIDIYPDDLFPKNMLQYKLSKITKTKIKKENKVSYCFYNK